MDGFSGELDRISEQENAQQNVLTGTSEQIEKQENLLRTLRNDILAKEKNLATQQKSTNEHINKIRAYESDKKIKNEQMRHLQDKEMRLTAELNNDKKQLEHVLYTIKRLNEELFEEQGKLDVYQLDIEKDKNEVEELRAQQTSSKAKLDNFVRESSEIQNNIYKLEKDIAVLNIQKEALQQESLRTISDTSSKEAELSEFNIVVDDLEERVAQQQEQFDNALQAEEELQTQMQIIEKRLQETREQLNREARLVDAKQNEYNLTKSLVDNLEGFPESIKFLRKNAGWKNLTLYFRTFYSVRKITASRSRITSNRL